MKNESCKVVLFIIKVVLFVFSILKKMKFRHFVAFNFKHFWD